MSHVWIVAEEPVVPRVEHGLSLLAAALKGCGFQVERLGGPLGAADYRRPEGWTIFAGVRGESRFIDELEREEILGYTTAPPEGEGFYLASCPGRLIAVVGGSPSGALYGCQELARIVAARGELPLEIAQGDAPAFRLRGPALGLQKMKVEPPRRTYEYPITPDRFPWFYEKERWIKYLDALLEHRCNVVYVWSGHPFSSLVKLDDYPEALEVTEEEFALNVETFRWLAQEAERRGIWVVLKFYNIHIPLPFARKHDLDLHQPKPLPITSDYTRKAIAAFIRSFPNVGLMVCLGEALQGHLYGTEWFRDTIIAGVNEGLAGLNVKEKPPVILRAHAINAEEVVSEAIRFYPNLYTMAKYNGESLTTWLPRGTWQKRHRHLASLDSVHIINVHILANLEPFRWGAPSFVQKAMLAAKHRLNANGLHLYPLFYWDWPYSPDKAEPRLEQIERDWLWYAAWFRYAWNPERDPETERLYWAERIGRRFGSREAGEAILEAYEASGECAPRILRRFGITEGNRQTLSLGMTLSQLTNPDRYRPYADLWESHAPRGERLEEYAAREARGEPHFGETPLDVIESAESYAERALAAAQRARPFVSRARDEFERFARDVEAIRAMVRFYGARVRAALKVLEYKHRAAGDWFSHLDLLDEALERARESVEWYRRLTRLTEEGYLYANSLLTPHRRIPFPDGERYSHWRDCLPLYEAEVERFAVNVELLRRGEAPPSLKGLTTPPEPYAAAPFELLSEGAEVYTLAKGSRAFTDGDMVVQELAEELVGLRAVRFSQARAASEGVALELEFSEPCKVLIGYFRSKEPQWLQPPDLEVNAHAVERGGTTPVIKNGAGIFSYPSVNVHALRFEPGRHRIDLGKGVYLFLGVVKADQPMVERDARAAQSVHALDWLYE